MQAKGTDLNSFGLRLLWNKSQFPRAYDHGPVVQLVRTLACHARGRGFEPHPGRQYAFVAQSVEQRTENPRVVGSIPTEGTISGFSSSGRAPPCQGGGSEFEPRNPLQTSKTASLAGSGFVLHKHELAASTVIAGGDLKSEVRGDGSGFEPRNPLQTSKNRFPRGKRFCFAQTRTRCLHRHRRRRFEI